MELSKEELSVKMLAASREIRKGHKILCPVCGKLQYKMGDGGITSFVCSKCNTEKSVMIIDGFLIFGDVEDGESVLD